MPIDNAQLAGLVGDIYDCALDHTCWVPTLARLAGATNACNGTILHHSLKQTAFSHQWGVPEHAFTDFAATYAPLNPLLTMPWHCEVDEPVSLGRFMTDDELRGTRFHREFLAPLGWFDFVAVVIEKSATETSVVSLNRLAEAGAPHTEEIALMRLLAPHIRRSLIFHGVVERAAARVAGFAAVMNVVQAPVLLFDAGGKCIEANAAAERFLADSAVLWLDGGRVRATARGMDAQIDVALAAAAAGGIDAAAQSLVLVDSEGRRFVAHVMPLAGRFRDHLDTPRRAVAAMFVQAVGDLQPLPGEVLVKLYGLTPAETRLIGLLAQDRPLEDCAAALGIAVPTARTHLQRIFDKTGTSRQAQLMRLVLSALPQPPA